MGVHGRGAAGGLAAGGAHSAIRLPNGNTLIACGDGKGGNRIFEADAAGDATKGGGVKGGSGRHFLAEKALSGSRITRAARG